MNETQEIKLIRILEDAYNDLNFFDDATIYDAEKQANEVQNKLKLALKLLEKPVIGDKNERI